MDGTPEPEIDRVKLLRAWELNAETQRAVLRRSNVVGVLAVAATLLQVGVAWYVLKRMDEVAHGAMAEVADMKGMLRASLAATTAVNAIEIEEKAAEASLLDALVDEPAVPEPPAEPGTVQYRPETATEILSKAAWRAKGKRAGGSRGEGKGLGWANALSGGPSIDEPLSSALAEEAPAAPEPPAAKAMLERRQAAQVQIEQALEQLAAPSDEAAKK
jgi:hypothetical protein